ncbi:MULTISPECIES: sulfurtransferase complex subunit TusD [unclassified Oceanobacter]|uniref:sulfurtransferase complex subunit TusD n=1 Tax=unclassified Oceanobacter TaxID=2620260 RepID=UPI002734929F|nr:MULTISPECIES: sulfurtransferase complex subunit TusD [unclassified Oceanobacter]MDP2608742.1 sulfurtransferase complex subunit TusD [Oceanobacter sp. 1_MG-2023]MDP2611838.1 sulfurtransferase complex subunit TusD [Oceanobacter sp. 2_MG-2023]
MASFSLLLTASPFLGASHQQAQDFVRAALAQGHQIHRVFFYQDAVLCGSNRIQSPQGQQDIGEQWQQLANTGQFPLQLCIANSIRRGLVDQQESERYDLPGATLQPGFELAGLGEMADACAQSDRILEF